MIHFSDHHVPLWNGVSLMHCSKISQYCTNQPLKRVEHRLHIQQLLVRPPKPPAKLETWKWCEYMWVSSIPSWKHLSFGGCYMVNYGLQLYVLRTWVPWLCKQKLRAITQRGVHLLMQWGPNFWPGATFVGIGVNRLRPQAHSNLPLNSMSAPCGWEPWTKRIKHLVFQLLKITK